MTDIEDILSLIESGTMDAHLNKIKLEIGIREGLRRKEVTALVREVFGETAEITIPRHPFKVGDSQT